MKNSFDLIVLGAGSGGLAAAKRAASYGAKVAIVEGDRVGGTCVIRGCVPKKLLVYGSLYKEHLKQASSFGVQIKSFSADTSVLLSNVRKEVDRLNALHIQLLAKNGVDLIEGWAHFIDSNTVEITSTDNDKLSRKISGDRILIAVGGRPVRPDVVGADLGWVSDDLFLLNSFPKEVVVVGAGFIACEFACILNSLGVQVRQIVRGNNLLKGFDHELSEHLKKEMESRGIQIYFSQKISMIEGQPGNLKLKTNTDIEFPTEGVLFATGRKPYLDRLKLQSAGVEVANQRIKVNSKLATNIPNIYAVGDVTDRITLTPVAIDEGRAFADSVFGKIKREVNYEIIPTAVFSQPELAAVGLSEIDAIARFGKENILIYRASFRPMSQALSKIGSKTILKLIVNKYTDQVIGCHMLGDHSAEIIQMAAIAIGMGATKSDFDRTMALHPTIAEEFVTMK